MKKNRKVKLIKKSYTLSMEDLQNLEVISDEILYSLDLESLDQFLKDIPDLDEFIEMDREKLEIIAKPDFNGFRLDKERATADDKFFEDVYSLKDDCDKNILLDSIFDAGDEREVPILTQIIINEDNLGIREKALKILNGITVQNYWYSEEEGAILEIEKIRDRCIFKPLFETADSEIKLVLLQQIVEIGDTKELIFLNTLLKTKDLVFRKEVVQTIIQLKERLQLNLDEIDYENKKDENINAAIKASEEPNDYSDLINFDMHDPIDKVENHQNRNAKMPLNLTSLLEAYEIKEFPSSDILNIQSNEQSVNNISEVAPINDDMENCYTPVSNSYPNFFQSQLLKLARKFYNWVGRNK